MDVKNTYRACSDNRKVSGFLLGLVVALSLFLVALEFTSQSGMPEVGDDVLDDVSQDIEMMPAVHRDDMVAAASGAAGLLFRIKSMSWTSLWTTMQRTLR